MLYELPEIIDFIVAAILRHEQAEQEIDGFSVGSLKIDTVAET